MTLEQLFALVPADDAATRAILDAFAAGDRTHELVARARARFGELASRFGLGLGAAPPKSVIAATWALHALLDVVAGDADLRDRALRWAAEDLGDGGAP